MPLQSLLPKTMLSLFSVRISLLTQLLTPTAFETHLWVSVVLEKLLGFSILPLSGSQLLAKVFYLFILCV